MGLFSSSTKYYAYAGTTALFDEDNRPNTVLSLMVNGILGGEATPPEAIITGLNTNLYARAKSMIKYTQREDGYIFGFPTTNQDVTNITNDLLRPFIEAEAGGPIDFRSVNWGEFFDRPDFEVFFIERAINQNYLNTAYFPWPIGNPLDDNWSPVDDSVEIPIEDPGNPGNYYISNNEWDVDINGSQYQVSFPYSEGTWDVAQAFNLSQYQTGEWIMVRYRMQGVVGQYLYWTYEIGSGANPELEEAIEREQVNMEYLPIAVLMHDTVWFDESEEPPGWEETLDRLLKDLTLDPYDMKEQYLEQQEEDNASGDPDRANAETWDFFVQFGVPIKSDIRGAREYLFYFFDFLRTRWNWISFDDYQAWLAAPFGEQPASNLSVEEGVEYTGYIARYAWSYIERLDVDGDFTPPGWTEPLRKRRMWSHTYQLGDSDYNEGLDLVHGAGNYIVATSQPEGQEHSYTILTRRNEDETHTHILMMGPSMEYQINTSQDPVGVGAGGYVDFRYRFVDVELFPEDIEEESEFRWPIHIGTLKKVSSMHREPCLADSLSATVFLVERVKVKWYQKSFFRWLIIIIAIVVIILSWHYQLLPTIATAATAATGATALGLWALYVVLTFAIGFLISFASSLIGGNLGQIFMIVGMYMAMGGSFSNMNPFTNMSSAWSNLTTTPSWGSAIRFIRAVYPALNVGQKVYSQHELHKLESEMRDFEKTAKEKYEQLQDAWDELGTKPSWLDPLDLARTFATSGLYENPESFYYRTLHANPGTVGYHLVENFTNMALMLPETPGSPQVVDNMIQQFAEQRGQV